MKEFLGWSKRQLYIFFAIEIVLAGVIMLLDVAIGAALFLIGLLMITVLWTWDKYPHHFPKWLRPLASNIFDGEKSVSDQNALGSKTPALPETEPNHLRDCLHIGSMRADVSKLKNDLVIEISAQGVHSWHSAISISSKITGCVKYDGEKLPTPRLMIERGPTGDIQPNVEFGFWLEQRVPKNIATAFWKAVGKKQQHLYLDELNIEIAQGDCVARVPVWDGIAIQKIPRGRVISNRVIRATASSGVKIPMPKLNINPDDKS